jgi:hypothetical protein
MGNTSVSWNFIATVVHSRGITIRLANAHLGMFQCLLPGQYSDWTMGWTVYKPRFNSK